MLQTTDVDNSISQLVYTVTTLPANGAIRVSGTALAAGNTFTQADIDAGLVTYDHDDSQTSSDSFAFTVDDGTGTTSSGTFNFTITNVNDAPVISIEVGDSTTASLTETNGTLTGSGTLSVTDVDPGDTVTASVISVTTSGATTGLASDNSVLLAMLAVNNSVLDGTSTTGDINWTFNSASEAFNYLAVGQQLTLVYTIEVEDLAGATDTQAIIITITGTNDTPTIAIEAGDRAVESLSETNTTLTTSGTLTVIDLDLTDTVTSAVTSVVASGTINGLPSNNAALLAMLTSTPSVLDNTELTDQLSWAFNSGSEHFNYLAAGQSLVLTYTITVTDSQAATDTQTVVITINGTNDAPVISLESSDSAAASLTETNATLTTSGTLTVMDLDLSDTVTSAVSSVVATGTTNGLQSNNAALLAMLTSTPNVLDNTELTDQLTWAFNSGVEHFNYLATGQSLVLTYTITVTDSQAATDTQTVVITINGTNDVPVISVESGDSAAEGLTETNATLTTSGTLTVMDMDLTDTVTSAVTSVVASGTTDGLGSNNAALFAMLTSTPNVLDNTELTDQLTWAFNSGIEHFNYLAAGQSLVLTYTITVTDSQAATDTQTVVITINGTNDAR